MRRPTIICMTPTRNEALNLPRFLAATSLWADHIVVCDQQSTDGSRNIILQYPKAILIDNPAPDFNEVLMRSLLLQQARTLPGPRLLFALDADEVLSADMLEPGAFEPFFAAAPGTVFYLRWLNLLPGQTKGWFGQNMFALLDDDTPASYTPIHGPRLPAHARSPRAAPEHPVVLHYQYVDWNRMLAKQRWYQCWELLRTPGARPIGVYRRYHHMHHLDPAEVKPVPNRYFAEYETRSVRVRDFVPGPTEQWDRTILEWFAEYGPEKFSRLDIWDVDWAMRAETLGMARPGAELSDPRTWWERRVLAWLGRTQNRQHALSVRIGQRLLRAAGW